jgi:prepilin-type N-terminal cleavage/methylation domain-containing protein
MGRDETRPGGFSLIETLIVLAIISILMAMLATALTKALRMAKSTAAGEEMRVERIGTSAKAVHEGDDRPAPESTMEAARASFRVVHTTGMEKITSSVLFVVRRDIEFRAYWHTLLNRENTQPPEFTKKGALIAFTPGGDRFELPPVGRDVKDGPYPVAWEFISTHLNETGRGDAGGNVVYSDGRREYVPYPRKFPMSKGVALLSHRFVSAFGE